MDWQAVIEDPVLQDLPYKMELNEWGNIVMSPASNEHSLIQGLMVVYLDKLKADGRVFPECSIAMAKGVKVPDVVWASDGFLKSYGTQTPYPVSPELCVEIQSPSNSLEEIHDKVQLYLAKGAKEVWICDCEGKITFYGYSGIVASSSLVPDFPDKISK